MLQDAVDIYRNRPWKDFSSDQKDQLAEFDATVLCVRDRTRKLSMLLRHKLRRIHPVVIACDPVEMAKGIDDLKIDITESDTSTLVIYEATRTKLALTVIDALERTKRHIAQYCQSALVTPNESHCYQYPSGKLEHIPAGYTDLIEVLDEDEHHYITLPGKGLIEYVSEAAEFHLSQRES